jgi:hypothetical protein
MERDRERVGTYLCAWVEPERPVVAADDVTSVAFTR